MFLIKILSTNICKQASLLQILAEFAEHQLPFLSFPASLIYLLLMSQSALPSPSFLSHVPVTPGRGFTASTHSAQFPSWLTSLLPACHTVWQQHLPWKTLTASQAQTATVTEALGMAKTVCP